MKKVYADDPRPPIDDPYMNIEEINEEEDIASIIMNEVSASKYEEFEVIKINERGTRQKRILGIDQFKIYNKPFKVSLLVKFFFCNENRE